MSKLLDATAEENPQTVLPLDELARQGARKMPVDALEAEVADYLARHQSARTGDNHALVVRNGHAQARRVTMGSGTVEVRAPRINDRRVDDAGTRMKFTSAILPPYMRRSPQVAEVLPLLYLRGLSTGDFAPALQSLLGEKASGLPASAIARMTDTWQSDYAAFKRRDMKQQQYVYLWADGVHFNVRLEEDRLCTLVLIGARADGQKEVIAVEDGYRESKESWASIRCDLSQRGMAAPVVAVGDGALGFWAAVRDVWPQTREQRCWVHKLVNVLDKLPKRLQGRAKRALRDIMYAETKADATRGMAQFAGEYEAKYPKAVAPLQCPELLTYFDYPVQHWVHLRSSSPIESSFATVRLRQRVTKGAGTRTKALLMAYKLLAMAQQRWRRLNAPHLLPAVQQGTIFVDGLRPDQLREAAA